MSDDIISISVPPFPDFIEGNYRMMKKGQNHINRRNLGYFDLIAVNCLSYYLTDIIFHGDRVRRIRNSIGCIFIQRRSGGRAEERAGLFPICLYRNYITINVLTRFICRSMR